MVHFSQCPELAWRFSHHIWHSPLRVIVFTIVLSSAVYQEVSTEAFADAAFLTWPPFQGGGSLWTQSGTCYLEENVGGGPCERDGVYANSSSLSCDSLVDCAFKICNMTTYDSQSIGLQLDPPADHPDESCYDSEKQATNRLLQSQMHGINSPQRFASAYRRIRWAFWAGIGCLAVYFVLWLIFRAAAFCKDVARCKKDHLSYWEIIASKVFHPVVEPLPVDEHTHALQVNEHTHALPIVQHAHATILWCEWFLLTLFSGGHAAFKVVLWYSYREAREWIVLTSERHTALEAALPEWYGEYRATSLYWWSVALMIEIVLTFFELCPRWKHPDMQHRPWMNPVMAVQKLIILSWELVACIWKLIQSGGEAVGDFLSERGRTAREVITRIVGKIKRYAEMRAPAPPAPKQAAGQQAAPKQATQHQEELDERLPIVRRNPQA